MTPSLQLRAVTLRVPELAPSVDFYSRQLGFAVSARTTDTAELSVSEGQPPILTLVADPGAPPAPANAAGLFHVALVLPSRAALAGWLRHAAATGVKFDGFSDHGVSEAIYLTDPHGNGLEFYADRPRSAWPMKQGELAMFTLPLDLQGLLALPPTAANSLLAGAHWGHLHLRVTNLERSEAFYLPALGLTVTQGSFPGARFLAADGYHHHLGINTWGSPRLAQPPNALGLAEATFAYRGSSSEKTVRDPDGIAIRVQPLA